VTVSFTTRKGTAKPRRDFKSAKGKLTFAPGQTRRTVKVLIVPDNKKEKTEKFTLVLSSPVSATLGRRVATGTIKDDD
jgi:hypothetical protein